MKKWTIDGRPKLANLPRPDTGRGPSSSRFAMAPKQEKFGVWALMHRHAQIVCNVCIIDFYI